jgi:hypothetical protein
MFLSEGMLNTSVREWKGEKTHSPTVFCSFNRAVVPTDRSWLITGSFE